MFKLKNIESPWFSISVALNAFFILCLTLFTSFFWNLDVSAKMGDAVGGTLGAFANFAALTFIYKAYLEQRIATRNDLSLALYSEAISLVRNGDAFFVNLTLPHWVMTGNKLQQMSGIRLLQHFNPTFTKATVYENINRDEIIYLTTLVECYYQFQIHLERIEQLKRRMVEPYQLHLDGEITIMVKSILNPVDSTFNQILEWGKDRINSGQSISDATQFNQILACVARYQSISSKINSMGFKGELTEIVSIFDGEPNGITTFGSEQTPEPVDEELHSSINWSTGYSLID